DHDQDGQEHRDQAHGQGGGVLGGADHRGAGADGAHVDQGAGGGLGGVDHPPHGGPDQGLDGVVDVVDDGHLVQDELGHQQDRDHGQGPAALDPAVGLGEGEDVGEPGQDADQQQRDVET